MSEINVKKRDGRLEPLDLNKIHRVLDWAAEGLDDVSVSQVELKSHIQFYNGMRTQDIHEIMIKSTADLITENEPDYQYMAARLSIFNLRKIAYGEFTPPHMYDHAVKMVETGKYDKVVLEAYSKEEYDELNEYIDHWRDMNFSYGAVKQLEGKYLVQNRVTKEVFESPQMLYMFAAMCIFSAYPKETRLDYVKRFYDHTSKFDISLPTPIMSGMRTPTRQFASCTVIKCGDSIDSINASTSAIVKYVSKKAGIGLDISSIRAEGSEIRGGEAFHTGLIPFIKMFQAAVGSSSQGGVRKGSATLTFPLWHKDVESLIVLKNNRGVEDNRARHLDYSVAINGFLYKRLIGGKDITLFSPHDVKDMLKAFYDNQEEFARLYEKYEADDSIDKTTVKAVDLFSLLMNERAGTGRIYITNIDHMNTHGAFKEDVAPIVSSNLCQEIALPTRELDDLHDTKGEISLCTLAAFNLGNLKDLSDFESWADILIRALDEVLDYQEYPVEAAGISTMNRRPLGIGVINYAYYLTKNGHRFSVDADNKWDIEANNLTHRTFEAMQYYLLKASMNVAKEKGACPAFDETKYSDGVLTIDTYKKDVDNLHTQELLCDWETLREDIKKYGLRNSTTSALMPSECQSKDNEMLLENGIIKTLGEILEENLDVRLIENNELIGQRFNIKPVYFADGSVASEVYYNGKKEVFEIEFVDGSKYKFTENHMLKTDNGFKRIDELSVGDFIYNIKNPIKIQWVTIKSIRPVGVEPTWDFTTNTEQYSLSNGCISHNTSSQVSGATNGIEPPRGRVSIKASKDGILRQPVPEIKELGSQYELLWDMPNMTGYLQKVAIMQKFVDQAISANTAYDPKKFPNGKVPMKQLLTDLLTAYKYGVKTLYYHNTRDGADDTQGELDDGCAGGACKI